MSKNFVLSAEKRHEFGTSANRRLRRQGWVPSIVYGGNKEPQSLTLRHDSLVHAYERRDLSGMFTLNVDNKPMSVIVRHVQHHPYKPLIQHIDFQRVSKTEILKIEVPIRVVGDDQAPGINVEPGILRQNLNEIEIECTADSIPERIEVDISTLHLGDSIHLVDIQLPEGMSIPALLDYEDMSEDEQQAANVVVAAIAAPKMEEEEKAEVEEEEEGMGETEIEEEEQES